jgi:D-glucuronyl C5-epimerase C-terminus
MGTSSRSRAARCFGARPAPSLAALIVVALWALAGSLPNASAAKVVLVDEGGRAVVRDDPFLPAEAAMRAPSTLRAQNARATGPRAGQPTVRSVLARLERAHKITKAAYLSYSRAFSSALTEVRGLSSARADRLGAEVEIIHQMAVNGTLTASRLPVLFLTLARNAQYWRTGALLSFGDRVEFAGSELVWEYYPGQGLQLQQLGSFGKADWLCTAGAGYAARCRAILAELIPLAVQRAGGLTWEYYFNFDGGAPPWTSAMSQGTALQALADASKELGDQSYLAIAHQALPVFMARPPSGVAVKTSRGARFVEYSFDSRAGDEVINAFLQSLIGLDDYAQTSGDPMARRLFAAGDAEARAELPRFNTGAWSLYQPGHEDDLSYHQLVTGFLQQLCSMTKTPVYCSTAAAFQADLRTPPALKLITTRVKTNQATRVYFALSKVSRVGITIMRGTKTMFLTSASFPYGQHSFAIPALRQGTYTVQLDATDLAGNYNQASATLKVSH